MVAKRRKGGNRTLAASAKVPSQIGKSGHSSLSNRTPNTALRTKVSKAQIALFANLADLRNQPEFRAEAQPAISAVRCTCEVPETVSLHSADFAAIYITTSSVSSQC